MNNRASSLLTILLCVSAGSACAQSYPGKAIRLVAPFSAGGTLDIIARTYGQKLGEAWGQQVLVDNRPGASGMIGADAVAKSPPDGYTILLASPGEVAVNQHLFAKMPYQPEKDLAPVSLAAVTPLLLVLHPSLPARTVRELIALARARPGQISYASTGTGGIQHLCGEFLKTLAGIDIVHVPYKGAGAALPDLIGGHVSMFFSGMPAALPHTQTGRLRALAVTTLKRSPAAPEVPTLAEAGAAGFDVVNWFAIFVPAATPHEIIGKLHAEIVRIAQSPDVKQRLAAQGAETVTTSPAELGQYVRSESAKYARIIKASGVKAE